MSLVAESAVRTRWLLCRAGTRLYAIPPEFVLETLRPLPIEALARSIPFVLGLCILRGRPTPVIDAGLLLGEQAIEPRRLVVLKTSGGLVALAFREVLGLRAIQGAQLPPLLRDADGDAVQAISTHDAELLLVLSAARIVPQGLLESLAENEASA